MTFLLKNITVQDRKKIINDAKSNPRIYTILKKRRYLEENNINLVWAIDDLSGNYLMSCPSPLHEPTQDTYYLFRFDEDMILLRVRGIFGNVAHICDKRSPPIFLQDDLKERIISAFTQYGRYGKGPTGDFSISSVSKGDE